MKNAFCVLAMLCFINISMVSSQVSYANNCTAFGIAPMANFTKERYSGLWYIQDVYNYPEADQYDCWTFLALPTLGITLERVLNIEEELKHRLTCKMLFNQPGKAIYYYETESLAVNVTIVGTDFTNYTIEWACEDLDGESQCYLWISTRGSSVPPAIQKKIDKILEDNNFDKSKLKKVKQGNKYCASTSVLGSLFGLLGKLLG